VVALAVLSASGVVVLDLLVSAGLTAIYDLAFLVICLAAVLTVRPRDFFVVGVLPPLLMLGVVAVLAVVARGVVAEEGDALVQAVVSGLAHHAGALTAGYALTLGILVLRQLAIRNSGRIRGDHRRGAPDRGSARVRVPS
jgi:hypothetical protein